MCSYPRECEVTSGGENIHICVAKCVPTSKVKIMTDKCIITLGDRNTYHCDEAMYGPTCYKDFDSWNVL